MLTRKAPTKPAGTTNANIQIPESLHEAMKAIREARHQREGADVKLCRIYREAVEQYIESIDAETGKPRLRPPSRSSTPAIVLPQNLPLFRDYLDCDQFADDIDLFCAMDKSWMMLWTSAPNGENLHVNPTLEAYAGRSDVQFRNMGWVEAIHPEDRARTLQISLEGTKTREAFRQAYRLRRGDGLYGWIIDHAQPRFRLGGEFGGYVGTIYQVAAPGTSAAILSFAGGRWTSDESVILAAGAPQLSLYPARTK